MSDAKTVPLEVYETLVRVVKACTGSDDGYAKQALSEQGLECESVDLLPTPNPTPVER